MSKRNLLPGEPDATSEDSCQPGCGECCANQTIPVTLIDVERIAACMNIPVQEVFRKYIQKTHSGNRSTFILRKNANRTCAFLNPQSMCNIYEARPRICQFYHCSQNSKCKFEQIINRCSEEELKRQVLEHAVASSATAAYIEKCGSAWNDVAWKNALAFIRDNELIHRADEFRISWRPDGTPMISHILEGLQKKNRMNLQSG